MVIEVRLRHTRNIERVAQGDLFVLISEHYIKKFSGIIFWRAAESDALFLCGSDAFRLPCADVFPLVFRDEGEDLQNEVGNELPDEGAGSGTCIEQGHIEDEDIRPYGFRNATPFVYDHLVIASQTVYGFNDEQVSGSEFSDESEIVCTVEVFAALLVAEDMSAVYIHFGKGFELTGEILVARGNAGVSVSYGNKNSFLYMIAKRKAHKKAKKQVNACYIIMNRRKVLGNVAEDFLCGQKIS